MPKYGVAIEKSVSFRGVQQPFSNRYHYEGATMTPAQATQLAQNVAGQEKVLHSTDVSFKYFRVWLDTGNKATSEMVAQGNLSGVGQSASSPTMDRERAVLIQWRAGSDSRGRPVFLRKWYHVCGQFGSFTFQGGHLQNTLAFTTSERNTINQAAGGLEVVSDGADAKTLAAPPGRQRTGQAQVHPYLEHHQLGDQWR